MWGRGVLLVSFALIALGITMKCPKRRMSPVREILCYTSTFDVELLVDSVCSCTTLVHENHDVRNLSISDIADLRKSLKEMHPSLQFVISVHDPAKTLRNSAMVRQEAIARIIAVMKEVDGVEINVTAGSKERLYNFVKSLKNEMVRKSYDKRIFVVLPSKQEDLAKQYDLKELIKYIDLFTLPTDYLTDEDGSFVTFHPSRLMGLFDMLNTDSLVDLISGLGAPKQKILMTLPANAYKFTLHHEAENAPRSQTSEKDPVAINRKQLCEAINNGEWTVERDEDLTAPYAFQNKTWIAFEDKISVGIKGKYALLRDLAGLAVRNIESDMKTECEKPLSQEIYHSFTEFNRKSRQAVLNALEDELHQTQFSYPNQAKTSSFRIARIVDTEGHIRAVRENTQTEFICRRQGYFVHPKSCNRFYRCVKFNQAVENYSVFEFDCPAGLSFDERTEVCVWPGSLPQGSPCPGSSEIAPVAPKRFKCSQPGYYADPQNCRWFFACMDLGEPELMAFEFRCPYGLVFDEKKLVCEWPWLVPACSESGSTYTRTEYDYREYTAGTSTGIGVGGYVTSSLPEYSATGTSFSNIDYSKTTNTNIHGVNYFGSTIGQTDKHSGISISDAKTISGHIGLSDSNIDYSKSSGYGGSVTSLPTYSGSSGIYVGSISPNTVNVGEGITGYSASSSKISNTGHIASIHPIGYTVSTSGVNIGYANTGSLGRVTTSFSGPTAGGPPADYSETVSESLSNKGVTYLGISGSDYSGPVIGGHTGSIDTSNPIVDTVGYSKSPETSYFRSTGLSGSSTDAYTGSTNPEYVGSISTHIGSGSLNVNGYSASTDIYSGATGHQPLLSQTEPFENIAKLPYPGTIGGIEITGSTNRGYTGSSRKIYEGSTAAGYSKTTSGINVSSTGIDVNLSTNSKIESNLKSSTSSGRIPGIGFTDSVSKSRLVTSGIPTIYKYTDITTADNDHFVSGNIPSSGAIDTSSIETGYDGEKEYTIPVFVQQKEPIYPSIGTGVRDYTGTTGRGVSVTSGYEKTDLARPNLNISIFGNKIPTGYGIQKINTGTTLSGSSIEGSILTGDSFSGTVFNRENIPGIVLTPTINQGTVLTGGAQSGYAATSSGTAGYVINDKVKTIDAGSASPGSLIYGTSTPAILLSGPSTSSVIVKDNITPSVVISGQTAPGISIGGSIQPGTIESSTGKTYVSQSGITYHGSSNAAARGSVTYSNNIPSRKPTFTTPHDYRTNEGRGTVVFNTDYNTGRYSENDIPDYRPTSATLPEPIVSGNRIEGNGGFILGSTLTGAQGLTTAVPRYSSTKSAVFTPSGFTKTGPTRTGITTALLGGGGSYSVSTSERRPILNPENISEKAFQGNVAGYTKTSFIDNAIDLSVTLTPPGYSSTGTPGDRVTLESATSGYSYPKPTIQFGTSSVMFPSASISSTNDNKDNFPITTSTPFSSVVVDNKSPDNINVFDSKIPTVSTDRHLPIPTVTPILTTKHPEQIYRTTLLEAAKISMPMSISRPVIDTGYKTIIVPTNIPVSVLTDDRFTQQTGNSQIASISTIGLGVPSQQTDLSNQKDYSSSTSSSVLGYLPAKTSKPGIISSTRNYEVPTITVRPDLIGITYKKPSSTFDVRSEIPFSDPTSSTMYRPYNSINQEYSHPSITTLPGSPTNLDISRDKIDKLITNYERGTIKYKPSVYDTFSSTGFDSISTKEFSSSSSTAKSLFSVKTGNTFAITTPCNPTTFSYEVTTKSPESKHKVIVKWSDLHPLLLGKLGAECTCKADPFATLRGPVKKLITSSKGKIDLANYDESDIYVDLENGSSYEEDDYITNSGDLSPQPFKISPHETTSATMDSVNLPSSSYLPISSTTASTRDFVPPIDIRTGIFTKSDVRNPFLLQGGRRTGRKLKDVGSSPNSLPLNQENDPDQIIDGATNCARPGLFRHPSLCNKFYACHWDQWKKKFTLHIFNCPVHLTFDSSAGACNWPSKGPACQADNLLV